MARKCFQHSLLTSKDTECSNPHPFLSTLRSEGLRRSKMKWRAIYTNLPVNAIVRIPHPWSGHSQGQETFSAPSTDKQTRNYDTACSNHHLSISTLRSEGLIRNKMKLWAIYTNLPVNAIVRLPILRVETARARKRFQHPLLTSKPTTMTKSAQTTIPLYQPLGQRDWFEAKWNCEPYIQIYQWMP